MRKIGCLVLITLVIAASGCSLRQSSYLPLSSAPATITPSPPPLAVETPSTAPNKSPVTSPISDPPPNGKQPTSSEVTMAGVSMSEVDRNDPESVALAFTYALIGNDQMRINELWRHDTPPSQDIVGYLLINGKPPTIYEKPRVEQGSLRPGRGPGYVTCDVLAKVQTWDGAFWYRFVYVLVNQSEAGWMVTGFSQPTFQGADDPTLKSDYLRRWKRVSGTFTFEQELEPNRWLVIPTSEPEARGIVQLSFDQIELAAFQERFGNKSLKGSTLIVKGEDGGLDQLGRKIFVVKGNSGLIPPEMS